MGKYDLFLGKTWLTEFNRSIHFEKNTLTLTYNDQCYRLAATRCGVVIHDHSHGCKHLPTDEYLMLLSARDTCLPSRPVVLQARTLTTRRHA